MILHRATTQAVVPSHVIDETPLERGFTASGVPDPRVLGL